MSLPYYIARRLPLRSTTGGVTGGVGIAVTGISLSIAIMLIAIAVLTGFRTEIKQKVMGFDAQIAIAPTLTSQTDTDSADAILIDKTELDTALRALPPGATATLTIRQPAILKTPDNFAGCIVKSLEPDGNWDFVRQHIVEGHVPDYTADSTLYHTVISRTLARTLNLHPGDKIDTYFIGNDAYRLRRLKIAGIYDTHFSDYDRNILFASIDMLRGVGQIPPGKGTILEINGLHTDPDIHRTAAAITSTLLDRLYTGHTTRHFTVQTIHQRAAIFFSWLTLLDTNVAVILTLMALLALLTLISSLFILILRRVRLIGILKALGATNRLIRTTFILLSLRILLLGLTIGNAVGLGIILLQRTTRIIPLDPEAYYLDHVPMEITPAAIIILNLAVSLAAIATLILPSAIITRISPTRAASYE